MLNSTSSSSTFVLGVLSVLIGFCTGGVLSGPGVPFLPRRVAENDTNTLAIYYRIEAELVNLENNGGIRSTGAPCDSSGSGPCDPILYAYIDVQQPNSPFPGALTTALFPKVFAANAINSPRIGAIVSATVCNQKVAKGTLRVRIMDRNKIMANSLINDYDCYIEGRSGVTPNEAEWTRPTNCVGHYIPGKTKLVFRSRIYHIKPDQCSGILSRPAKN
ncbi:hypothetical protein BV898_12299 [Hypsibius exemplaris]|uniref:Uncharacterized protein n=1 Tax=Hypsibius exemplaris TaxID=2072580 RepID=A0A1W0WE46_HYPEX|nr:hypothetical protein BV898_12299 [Hypsibius exemplaris]